MFNILLSGSSGFIGSNILRSLSKKNKLHIILRKQLKVDYKFKKNIKIIKFQNYDDLNLKLKKKKIDIVIHCATHYVKKHTYGDIKKLSESNILLGNIILENAKIMGVKKFLNFSTVWAGNEKFKDFNNLYSTYKKSFSTIFNYYKKIFPKIKFYELMLSDTFGVNDQRPKIINTLRHNYKNNIKTKISSKNLYLNLLNVDDIISAVIMIVYKKILPHQYGLTNKKYFKVSDIISLINAHNEKKIKIKWQSNTLIKNKIYNYSKLRGWKIKNSNIKDIINYIIT